MKAQNVLYFSDNVIYLKNKKKDILIKYKVGKNILANGKIINTMRFIKTYEKLLSENSLNNFLFGETLKIIVAPYYNSIDINLLKNVFANFNYRKVIIDLETKYYKLNQTNAYLNVFDTYQVLSFIDEFKKVNNILITNNLFLNLEDLMSYIKYRIQDRELYLLGRGELLNNFFNSFEEKYHNKTYIFANHEEYLITKAN